MKVTFWGTRGSTPVPGKDTIMYGGNTTCLEVDLKDGQKVIIDAGTGIRPLGHNLLSGKEVTDLFLLITHIHWDHIFGFPFFSPIYIPSVRIHVDGYHSCIKGLRYSFDNKMGDGFFPIRFDELKANIRFIDTISRGCLYIDSTVIDSIPLQHPQGGLGFRFQEDKKKLVFLTDNELNEKKSHFGDYVDFCRDADLLIHDSHYRPDEIEKHRGWGHSDYQTVINLATEAVVKKLILFHHAPERKDTELIKIVLTCQEMIQKKNLSLEIEAARENSTHTL